MRAVRETPKDLSRALFSVKRTRRAKKFAKRTTLKNFTANPKKISRVLASATFITNIAGGHMKEPSPQIGP
jgi:hypothetical protein